jgi:hypothetical protein
MMSEKADLHAQIAQRLFGWTYPARAYTTDPAATAQVWQWLETRALPLQGVQFEYRAAGMHCFLLYADIEIVWADGATWPEALCRAALALAEALTEREEATP